MSHSRAARDRDNARARAKRREAAAARARMLADADADVPPPRPRSRALPIHDAFLQGGDAGELIHLAAIGELPALAHGPDGLTWTADDAAKVRAWLAKQVSRPRPLLDYHDEDD